MTPDFKHIDTNGISVRAAIVGAGPLVLLVHGWPESWHAWRHQMGPIAEAGFTACAIDVRGYGGSDKPHPVEAYAMREHIADLVGVIDALSPGEPAILIGHDWGAPMVWYTAALHADHVRAVAGLSVPHVGIIEEEMVRLCDASKAAGTFFYQNYFEPEGVAEAEIEADTRSSLRRIYYAASADGDFSRFMGEHPEDSVMLDTVIDPDPFPAWWSEADIDYMTGEFERSGFRGPLNRYRNVRSDRDWLAGQGDLTVRQPALYLIGDADGVRFFVPDGDVLGHMKPYVPNLHAPDFIPGVGHWTQQEKPELVTPLIVSWLKGL
ncbi:MAG: alpha/beta hydrolase [Pseudomonadota bacterium]